MKTVIAPNAFKGSLSASQAAVVMENAVKRLDPDGETIRVPVADGGDGLVEIARHALQAETIPVTVQGPLTKPVEAEFCYLPESDTAILEMARASGLALIDESDRDPTRTTTFGTGQLIAAALDRGARQILVGIGGSATTDGGIGMASALGMRFLDHKGKPVPPTGHGLNAIDSIDPAMLDSRIGETHIEVLCDVDNPLLGSQGAARVYGPQKGATPAQVERLEEGLRNLAAHIESDLGTEVRNFPGAGAAGGLGAGLKAFLRAELRPGIDVVLDLVGLEKALEKADLVLTAEGQIDNQTQFGKAPAGVAARARAHNIPCLALAGSLGPGLEELIPIGINACFSICPGPMDLSVAMVRAEELLDHATEQAVRAFCAGRHAGEPSPRP